MKVKIIDTPGLDE